MTAQIGRTMNGNRMWDIPRITPAVVRMSVNGSEISPRSIRKRLMIPVSRRSICQANVRTRRLDQNGRRTAIRRSPATLPGTIVIR